MTRLNRRQFLVTATASAALYASAPAAPRTVVVGDVHGDLDRFVETLTMAGLLDKKQKWAGRSSTLVQLGDVVDRGPDSRGVIEFLMKLEKDARKAKGQVLALIGNHEAMRMYGDLRYVPPAEYEAFSTPDSEANRAEWRRRMIATMPPPAQGKPPLDEDPEFLKQWDAEHPLGQLELLVNFSPKGPLGKWILERRAALVHDETLFVHGGISPALASSTVDEIDKKVKDELETAAPPPDGLVRGEDGPLWYRGLANSPEGEIAAHVDAVLANYKVKRIIVGHTPQLKGVVSRLGGKVILADVGLAKVFGGPKACVVIENGKAAALHEGKKIPLE